MLKKFSNVCVRIMNRFLPDPFLFAIILTIVVFIVGCLATWQNPWDMAWAWAGKGVTTEAGGMWNLLAFSMQMALVLVLGSAFASAPVIKKILGAIASLAKNKMSAIVVVTAVSTVCCWLNWGFGLIVGALLAKEVARRVKDVDYPLLIASAYSGFVIWHAGLSGSIPLSITNGYKIADVTYQAELGESILHPMNIIMCLVVLIGMPLINYAMHPDKDHTITVNPAVLQDAEERTYKVETPAEKIEHSKILWAITVIMGFCYIIRFFIDPKFGAGKLDLNVVNAIFLFLGLLAHGDLRRYVDAIGDAAGGAAGVLLQFPFYAGIMGIMVAAKLDADGNVINPSLAALISDFFVNISNNVTFPVFTFLSAGIVNFFVPSGGGQWAVQGPIVMPAATGILEKMGKAAVFVFDESKNAYFLDPNSPTFEVAKAYYGRAAMGVAWGDQWTNMIQPFWALPALGVAGLSAKDIMGYLVTILIFVAIVAILGFLAWGMIFA